MIFNVERRNETHPVSSETPWTRSLDEFNFFFFPSLNICGLFLLVLLLNQFLFCFISLQYCSSFPVL